MATPDGSTDTGEVPVERFKRSTGQLTGVLGLAFVVAALAFVVWKVHTLAGLRFALALVVLGTVVWISQLRPRLTAYADRLLLQNMLRDTTVPLRLVDEVSVRQTVNVWVGDQRHCCLGVGRSVRSLVGHKSPRVRMLGYQKLQDMADRAAMPHLEESTAMSYPVYVERRLEDLVAYARSVPVADADAGVRRVWAWPEVVLLVVASAGFLMTLLC